MPSSRTPEGRDKYCEICRNDVVIAPSDPPGDATCPRCGCLLWFSPENKPDNAVSQRDTLPEKAATPVEIAKAEILHCVGEFADVIKSERSSDAIYQPLMKTTVHCLAAKASVIWTVEQQNWLLWKSTVLAQRDELTWSFPILPVKDWRKLHKHAERVRKNQLAEKRQIIVAKEAHLLLTAPIVREGKSVAVIEILQRRGSSETTQKGYLKFTQQMVDMVRDSTAL
jgi:hypothetical protein